METIYKQTSLKTKPVVSTNKSSLPLKGLRAAVHGCCQRFFWSGRVLSLRDVGSASWHQIPAATPQVPSSYKPKTKRVIWVKTNHGIHSNSFWCFLEWNTIIRNWRYIPLLSQVFRHVAWQGQDISFQSSSLDRCPMTFSGYPLYLAKEFFIFPHMKEARVDPCRRNIHGHMPKIVVFWAHLES